MTRTIVGFLVILSAGALAGCGSDPAACGGSSLMLAPAGLTFTRLDATKGRFAWDPVAGATEYQLFVNGVKTKTMAGTTADLDIGPSAVDVTVAASNAVGMSPVSSPFPVLFDVRLRACSSMTASVTWATSGNTDTQLSISGSSPSVLTCFDPTPRTDHHYSEISNCLTNQALTFGALLPGSTAAVTMLSRDQLGYLGQYQQTVKIPTTACLCVQNPNNPETVCSPALDGVTSCSVGFNLETGTAATSLADADVYLEGTPNANGRWLDQVRLVAPNGLTVLKNRGICDIDEVPAGPMVTGTVYETQFLPADVPKPIGPSDAVVVKTRSGRFSKLAPLCNCPTNSDSDETNPDLNHLTASGMDFAWITAPDGATAFPE